MGEREIIATIYRSAGNDCVGDMWTETKIFKGGQTIEEIFKWVEERSPSAVTTKIVLTPAQ